MLFLASIRLERKGDQDLIQRATPWLTHECLPRYVLKQSRPSPRSTTQSLLCWGFDTTNTGTTHICIHAHLHTPIYIYIYMNLSISPTCARCLGLILALMGPRIYTHSLTCDLALGLPTLHRRIPLRGEPSYLPPEYTTLFGQNDVIYGHSLSS